MMVVMENKKISKKILGKVPQKRDPYLGIVLEGINNKLKVLVDGQEVLHERVDRLDTRMGRVEGKLDVIEGRVIAIDIRLSRVETKVDHLEIKVDRLEVRADRLEVEVGHLNGRFDVMSHEISKKVDKEEFIAG
jgi:chaperonin cofactor prefoldin